MIAHDEHEIVDVSFIKCRIIIKDRKQLFWSFLQFGSTKLTF